MSSMPKPIGNVPDPPIDSHNWDFAWSKLTKDMKQLYTEGVPANIHQLWMRCYFEDLWTYMGEDATKENYIELGAGRGTASMYLSKRGCEVTMLDLSQEGFKVSEVNFRRAGLKVPEMVCADAQDTKLPANKYGCVFSLGLVEHFEDPKPLLAEMLRIMKPGGRQYALIVPHRATPSWLTNLIFAPWRFVRDAAPQWLRDLIRGRRPQSQGSGLTRTEFGTEDYIRMATEIGAVDVQSVPYNAFHQVYRSPALDNAIVLPVYRTLLKFYKARGKWPLLKTHKSLASSELLTFRKPL